MRATSSCASGADDDIFEKLEHAVERKLDRGRQQQKKKGSLAKIVGDGAADLVFHVIGKIRLNQAVQRICQRQQLHVNPAQPIQAVSVQIGVDCIDDHDRDHQQHDLAEE